jgi:hypothetical protein
MQDIMIRIETGGFDAWNQQHYLRAQNRSQYGITDGPAYRDIDNPGAALFHISVADIDTAMQWFRSDTFKQASKLAKVTGGSFYLAQPTDLNPRTPARPAQHSHRYHPGGSAAAGQLLPGIRALEKSILSALTRRTRRLLKPARQNPRSHRPRRAPATRIPQRPAHPAPPARRAGRLAR